MLSLIARALAAGSQSNAPDFELSVDTAQLRALADKVKRLGPNNPHIHQGLTIIGQNWVNRIKANFRNSISPYGEAWAPIHHREGQPLLDTGALRNSIKAEVRGLQIVLGTNLKYGQNHNEGLTVKRRQFLPDASRKLPNKWQQECERILVAQIEKALQ
ncbi:phage virion morphogenesis protein [Pseudomonas asiatica]|uniref:Phage virion morphogenesis protein n=1 Tax=Pseudomonas asiatica TaxID=2219225 RepID=A0AAJ5ING9_9PSED|nr:phage virion morphogenesis protein [Pseudomonas asiatica]UUC20549.1 phage virion morphogenesis protein [Pseudomonas asiatica]